MMLPEPDPRQDYFKRYEDVDATTYREAGITYHRTSWGDLNDIEYIDYLRERFGESLEEERSRENDSSADS